MNKEQLLRKIDKIFRANTVQEVTDNRSNGTSVRDVIEDIPELKEEIKELITNEFKKGDIDRHDIFRGSGKLGASYHITDALEVARTWRYKYLEFNGELYDVQNGAYLNIRIDEV